MNKRERYNRFNLLLCRAVILFCIIFLSASFQGMKGTAAEAETGTSLEDPKAAQEQASDANAAKADAAGSLEKAAASKFTGLVADGEDLYYFEAGVQVKNKLIKTGGKTYYFNGQGKSVRGNSVKVGQSWLVFDKSGALSTGKKDHILRVSTENGKAGYLVHKNGSGFKKGWNSWKKKKTWTANSGRMACGVKKIGKHRYYFTDKGWLGTSRQDRIVNVDGKDYLALKSGELGSGWCSVGDKYCFCKKNGELLKDTVKDKIRINKNGLAKTRPMTPLEKKADSVVRAITSSKMSQSAKIAACWNYVTSHGNFSYRAEDDPGAYTQSEFRRLALTMLNIHGGNCYGFAATFAALTKAAGCSSYVIYGLCPGTRDQRPDGLTRHSWVYISGYGYFDPEGAFAGFANIYSSGSCPWIEHGRVAI